MYCTYHHTVGHKTSNNGKSHMADNLSKVTLTHSFKSYAHIINSQLSADELPNSVTLSRKLALLKFYIVESIVSELHNSNIKCQSVLMILQYLQIQICILKDFVEFHYQHSITNNFCQFCQQCFGIMGG